MAKNPLLIAGISVLPNLVKTISSIVKDKKERNKESKVEPETTTEAIANSVNEMLDGHISSKRVMNIAGTVTIISVALTDISTKGLNGMNLALISIGVAYSLLMSLITYLSEKR